MKIDECTPENVHTVGGGETPPCAGLIPNVLPEAQSTISAVSSHTGVSTRNVHTGTTLKQQKQEYTPPLVRPPLHIWKRESSIRLFCS